MSERPYTLSEIDEMRDLIRTLIEGPTLNWQFTNNGGCMGWSGGTYKETERAALVEDRLRTYMMNGTSAEELRNAVKALRAQEAAAREAAQEVWKQRQAEGSPEAATTPR